MKVLVIDNIDSFVYNLVQYVGELGAEVIVLENTASFDKVKKVIKSEKIDKIIISPGPKGPKDAGVSNKIIEEFGPKIPLLGVCLGFQCIGYVFGGKIGRARVLKHGKTSMIGHDKSELFKNIKNPFVATRYHSLVVEKEGLPACLKITATSEDGGEIMALKHKDYPIYGVQFHPESILTREGMKIMKNFLSL